MIGIRFVWRRHTRASLNLTDRGVHRIRSVFAATALLLVMGTSSARDYAAGQVWTYHVNPNDEGSTLQINKIEQDPKLGTIFHISVFGLRISNPRVAGGILTELAHLPVSKDTLDKSVESLVNIPLRPVSYEEGYAHWKQAFDAGHAGIYTISVAEIVTLAEQTMSKATK
jgi:hypothetical protein